MRAPQTVCRTTAITKRRSGSMLFAQEFQDQFRIIAGDLTQGGNHAFEY